MQRFFNSMVDVLKLIGSAALGLIGVIMAGFSWLFGEIGDVLIDAGERLADESADDDEEETEEVEEPES